MTIGNDAGLRSYIELKHSMQVEQMGNFYAIIDRIKIRRSRWAKCPLKTVAFFTSNHEFSLLPEELPKLIKTVKEGCHTRHDVEMLSKSGELPRVFKSPTSQLHSIPAGCADILCFNT